LKYKTRQFPNANEKAAILKESHREQISSGEPGTGSSSRIQERLIVRIDRGEEDSRRLPLDRIEQ